MKNSLIKLTSIGFFISLLAVAAFAQDKKEEKVVTDQKKSIIVQKNSPAFKVALSSNPSTGYSWFLIGDYSPAIIPVEHHYIPAQDNKAGASGFEEWEFRIKPEAFAVPEALNLRFVYMRPWQVQSVKEAKFQVITQDMSAAQGD